MKSIKIAFAGLFAGLSMLSTTGWAQETSSAAVLSAQAIATPPAATPVPVTPALATPSVETPAAEAQAVPSAGAKFATSGLAPGDVVTVHMYDFPDVGTVQVHVDGDGTIHLPYAGTVKALGLSPDDLQKAITEALKSRGIVKEPIVTVETVSAANLNVTVIGQVSSPHSIPLYAPAPLAYVLGQVGGITGLASPHLTVIHNTDRPPTSITWDPDRADSAALNTLIEPGDIINVSSRGVYFMEGEVNRPGIYPLGGVLNIGQTSVNAGMGILKEITLLQALAQAGGISPIAARSKMHILRSTDGKREDIVIDQVKLSKGEIADPLLHANDIIYIPTSYLRQQTNNLFATALSGLYAATSIKSNGFY